VTCRAALVERQRQQLKSGVHGGSRMDGSKVAEYSPRWSLLDLCRILCIKFGYVRTLSCIWQYRVELVLDSVTRSPHKYVGRADVISMAT
jgi:hypothetical protein